MKIAHITTINSLKEISSKGQIDFCLLPIIDGSKEYKDYFINAIKKGRYVIGDNLIAEGKPIDSEKLVQIALELGISELIVPDVIGNYTKTKKQRAVFLNKYYSVLKVNNIKIMSVIQGQTFDEYFKCLREIEQDSRIDVVGIPFRIDFKDDVLDNLNLSKEERHTIKRNIFMNQFKFAKPIHLLGCNLLIEMVAYKNSDIRSMDSKLISRYSLNNEIINFNANEKPKKKLFIEDKMSKFQIKLCLKNIKILNQKMKGG